MAAETDPYRTLGLSRGASLDEVKRAYRRLVKINHPDAAGEAALPRFLAIQAAYDRIVGTARRGSRRHATPTRQRTDQAVGGRRRPGRCDPPRVRWSLATDPHVASVGDAREHAGRVAEAGPDAPPGTGTPPGTGRPPRPPKKATLGSTSYDGVEAEPFEPDWGGASWYGTTTGTYWTLNPKEYADPRKHGPEYQARARRAAAGAAAAGEVAGEMAGAAAADGPTAAPAPDDATAPEQPPPPASTVTDDDRPAARTTATWWAASGGGGAATAEPVGPTAAAPADTAASGAPTSGTAAAGAAPRVTAAGGPMPRTDATSASGDGAGFDADRWLEAGSGTLGGRVGRAVIGWAPIALGISWLAGELSGCGRFSASCDPAAAPLSLVAQVAVLALLLLVPRLAGAAVVATVATLAAAIPGALLLAAMGAAADPASSRGALGVLLVVGWVVGFCLGLVREVRRARPGDGPVS